MGSFTQSPCIGYNYLHQRFWRLVIYAHRVDATLNREGTLVLTNLPFHAGETVEVIVLPRTNAVKSYPL